MDLKRLHRGEWISGVAAMLLFVLMFFDWFGSKDSGELRLFSVDRTAWEAFDYISVILVIAIAAALGAAALRLRRADSGPSIPMNAIVAILGLISALLILIRIVDPPDFGSFREVWGPSRSRGPFSPQCFSLCWPRWGLLSADSGRYERPRAASDLERPIAPVGCTHVGFYENWNGESIMAIAVGRF